jgi:hypothetical protein
MIVAVRGRIQGTRRVQLSVEQQNRRLEDSFTPAKVFGTFLLGVVVAILVTRVFPWRRPKVKRLLFAPAQEDKDSLLEPAAPKDTAAQNKDHQYNRHNDH